MEIYIDFENTFHVSVCLAVSTPLAMTRGLTCIKGNLNFGDECVSIFVANFDGCGMWGNSNSVIHIFGTDK
jgi:hypothetical protein